ncbi:hypothetical protein EOM39_04870 [Candidatus Gracilibacteria bacterium]|nr:hypothetical protein [Candidatus Gracilibacteria bacterium]
MKNKKLLTGLLLTTVVVSGIGASFAADTASTGTTNTNKVFRKMPELTEAQKAEMEVIKTIIEKKKAGTTLTSDEQAKLTAFEANRPAGMGRGQGNRGGKMGERGFGFAQLTDAEKTALESMSDTEKQEFFEKKREEQKAKMEAHENVIDKVLAGSTLTAEEETIKQEIITQRTERKTKIAEMEAKIAEIKPILEKKKAGTTLTADEQTKLDEFEAERPEGKGFGRGR